jgi:hypothetical protein
VGEETTTTVGEETTTTVGEETTTTVGEETTTTVGDEVLPTAVTTTTQPDPDDGEDPSTLPFTGAATEGLGQLALGLLVLGGILVAVVGPKPNREEAEDL